MTVQQPLTKQASYYYVIKKNFRLSEILYRECIKFCSKYFEVVGGVDEFTSNDTDQTWNASAVKLNNVKVIQYVEWTFSTFPSSSFVFKFFR